MVNYHVLNDSIVLNYGGKTLVVSSSDSRYSKVLECITRERLDDIPAVVETERLFSGSTIELVDGLLHENGVPLPAELSDRILKHKEAGIPFKPLFKFWDNLKKNPSFNSRKMLFSFLSHNGHPLTQDGCFIAYRGVSEDFKDLHSGKFDNKPGSVCEIPREAVDENPNNTCSTGLHVACYDYAKGFGPKLVEVKVNPVDVVCVPTDYNGTKMRVCKFTVVAECEKLHEELVYDEEKEIDEDDRCWECDCVDCVCDCAGDDCDGCAECDEEEPETIQDDTSYEDFEECHDVPEAKVATPNYRHAKRGKDGRFVKKAKAKRKPKAKRRSK